MTDKEKLQIIKMWIKEAIHQGNRSVLVMAINSIIGSEEIEKDIGYGSKLKLTEKSKEILRSKI